MRRCGHPLNEKRPILSPPPPSPRRHAADTVFLSSSSLSLPFLFLKKIAALQKGPSCVGLGPPSALRKAPPALGTPSREGVGCRADPETAQPPARALAWGLPMQEQSSGRRDGVLP